MSMVFTDLNLNDLDDKVDDAVEEHDANVIPLNFVGMLDTDSTEVSSTDLASQALCNLSAPEDEQYAVRHAQFPACDFPPHLNDHDEMASECNIWEEMFPILFPFGEGGLERCRAVPLSLVDHVRWVLQYHDRQFRIHPTFAFMAFSILQRQQALTSAALQIR